MRGPMALLAVIVSVIAAGSGAGRSGREVKVHTGRAARPDGRAVIFIRRGCTECHAISALGVRASTDVGPDLTFAYADVVSRYGVNLESFLGNPSGVMQMMLASRLHLSAADRDSMVHILKGLYQERRADLQMMPAFPVALQGTMRFGGTGFPRNRLSGFPSQVGAQQVGTALAGC